MLLAACTVSRRQGLVSNPGYSRLLVSSGGVLKSVAERTEVRVVSFQMRVAGTRIPGTLFFSPGFSVFPGVMNVFQVFFPARTVLSPTGHADILTTFRVCKSLWRNR